MPSKLLLREFDMTPKDAQLAPQPHKHAHVQLGRLVSNVRAQWQIFSDFTNGAPQWTLCEFLYYLHLYFCLEYLAIFQTPGDPPVLTLMR